MRPPVAHPRDGSFHGSLVWVKALPEDLLQTLKLKIVRSNVSIFSPILVDLSDDYPSGVCSPNAMSLRADFITMDLRAGV